MDMRFQEKRFLCMFSINAKMSLLFESSLHSVWLSNVLKTVLEVIVLLISICRLLYLCP